eukprot:6477564-Pyramimonas_sp.AAC.1
MHRRYPRPRRSCPRPLVAPSRQDGTRREFRVFRVLRLKAARPTIIDESVIPLSRRENACLFSHLDRAWGQIEHPGFQHPPNKLSPT